MYKNILFLLMLFFTTGCCSYRVPTCHFKNFPPRKECGELDLALSNKEKALDHPIYAFVPRHRCQIRWYDLGHWCTWALFGNDEDGLFGEEVSYQLHRPISMRKFFSFGVRNPFHNFSHRVIGSKGRQQSAFIILQIAHGRIKFLEYQPVAKTVFPCHSTCFYLALHGWKPFISMRCRYCKRYRSECYLGWRCGGSFGIKLRPMAAIVD